MAKRSIIIKDFQGGIGTLGEKRDKVGSARFTKGLDPYEDTSYVTQARQASKISSTTVADLPYWLEDGSPHDTNKYVYDSAGKIYSIASDDTVSLLRTVSGGAGEGLKMFNNHLYYALGVNLGRYGVLSGTPTFDDDLRSWWNTQAGDLTDIQDSGGGTGAADYVPPTSIAETAAARQTFTASYDPIYSITIDVDVVGTGDWTVTLHDVENNELGTSDIANASMATGDVEFVLDSPARVVIDNSYHFHVTSTVADGGVDTETDTDLEGAEYTIEYDPLIDVDWHPMVVIDNTELIIGNERYVASFDEATYNPNKIVLDQGFTVRDIARFEEFVVIAAHRGNDIDTSEEGRLYFWDGLSASYNYSSSTSNKIPNSIVNFNGELIGVYGTKGDIYKGADPFERVIHNIPKLTKGKKVEVYPGGITEYEGNVLIGYAGSTDDGTTLEQGVYEFGRQFEGADFGFNYPYQISTETTKDTTVQIGLVKAVGNDLFIGWRDDTSYGIDKIERDSDAVASASYESLIIDAGDADKEFLPLDLSIVYEPLTANQSITPKYKYDRAATFTNGTVSNTVGDTQVEEILLTRCRELEIGFDLASTSNTFIKITEVKLEYDDLSEERSE